MNSIGQDLDVSENFPDLPPFPNHVTTAPLLRISLKKLLDQNPAELSKLYDASVDIGFFYLDLRDAEQGQHLLDDADALFQVGERLFDLSLEEKQGYDFSSQKSYFGYKSQGVSPVDLDGNLDRAEFYNISKDDIMGITDPLPAPDVLLQSRGTARSFIENSHAMVRLVLQVLNHKLGLPEGTLSSLHRLQSKSADQMRFIKAPPQPVNDRRVALGEHTDFGSVTVLFNRLGGLQVLPPGSDAEWVYVKPLAGHAIMSLGDAMVKLTNGLLRSNIHRVTAPPGIQGGHTRYSLVYFARPEDEVLLQRLQGSDLIPPLQIGQVEETISSKDWVIRRAFGLRVDLVKGIDFEKSAGTEQLSRRVKV
ncbi:hypothetical protein PDE_07575 [Penicillium oxalicum 114-2]|uniref:Fe2OG dioxygenase domain-containing protein n=1 Tax=Penicillium oxalicum (strain 114-2 / CGMCC 5302) TaxID=933388 RepID=S7ZPG7_PENO1|nr:hypothetical protein PDE_07575 [Penicillium oxalicum 114-2]